MPRTARSQVPAGKDPWWRMPVFSYHEGVLSSMHDRTFISAAQAWALSLVRPTKPAISVAAASVSSRLGTQLSTPSPLLRIVVPAVPRRATPSSFQARFPDLPRLTDPQREALDLVDTVAAEEGVRLDMTLRPGDMQFVHNHQARAVAGVCCVRFLICGS